MSSPARYKCEILLEWYKAHLEQWLGEDEYNTIVELARDAEAEALLDAQIKRPRPRQGRRGMPGPFIFLEQLPYQYDYPPQVFFLGGPEPWTPRQESPSDSIRHLYLSCPDDVLREVEDFVALVVAKLNRIRQASGAKDKQAPVEKRTGQRGRRPKYDPKTLNDLERLKQQEGYTIPELAKAKGLDEEYVRRALHSNSSKRSQKKKRAESKQQRDDSDQ